MFGIASDGFWGETSTDHGAERGAARSERHHVAGLAWDLRRHAQVSSPVSFSQVEERCVVERQQSGAAVGQGPHRARDGVKRHPRVQESAQVPGEPLVRSHVRENIFVYIVIE